MLRILRSHSFAISVCLAALAFTNLACRFPVMPNPDDLDALQQTKASLNIARTEIASTQAPTQEKSENSTTTAKPELLQFSYEGITFNFDPIIAESATGEEIPSQDKDEYGTLGDTYPSHVQVHFSGYALVNTYHEATLYIYPVAEYETIHEYANDYIGDLRSILDDHPDLGDNMEGLVVPFLPMWNAGQFFTVKPAYLDFQNGSGIRYLTMFGQDIYPVDNQRLLYTYQGLTNDEAYYISFVMPIAHPLLPDDAASTITDWAAFSEGWDNYISGIKVDLNELSPDQFSPPLLLLDKMVESLSVKP